MAPSSSSTATGSRSSSPATPENSDAPEAVKIQNADLSSWYQSLQPGQENVWETDAARYMDFTKIIDEPMLRLDDLIEQNAYDDSPPPSFSSLDTYTSPAALCDSPTVLHTSQSSSQASRLSDTLTQPQASLSLTKSVPPPPAPQIRKHDPPTTSHAVVYPPKESCYNLPIVIPSIPEGGTKSRVETQVRITVDLAHASSSSGEPFKYDTVGSWKWLKLPPGTATKKRTRKEGKIDPLPQDMLHLTANITCATPPHNNVLSCTSCQAREAKRVARKLAARVRPARSDSDSPEDPTSRGTKVKQEDTTSIVQFNCAEVLEFSTGSVVLPLRITCYCRHHREKVGFNVHFTMIDHTGRIVGTGTTRPIMITDDHKSTGHSAKPASLPNYLSSAMDLDWPRIGPTGDLSGNRAPSKRNATKDTHVKKRAKPYDISQRVSAKTSRETSVASFPSPSEASPVLPTRTPSPSGELAVATLSQLNDLLAANSSASPASSSQPEIIQPTPESGHPAFNGADMLMSNHQQLDFVSSAAATSPEALGTSIPLPQNGLLPTSLPFLFFNPGSPPLPSLQPPKIHRLIPNTGPTIGGIEVTVLGANFHPSVQLKCVFGDTIASTTQRWSDNTLLCILPPRATPGIVAVWFDGIQKEADGSPPVLFNYTDESDRALMELALQVVGLKMTGKIEDAKNVAMRIMGTSTSGEDLQTGGDTSHMMQLSMSPSTSALARREMRPLLMLRASENENLENVIVDFLSILDTPVDDISTTSIDTEAAISYTTSSGHTLLHLACFLGFSNLVAFLIRHDIDLDARDRNGYTALHFAALAKSKDCAKLLLSAGADIEIVNALGKTPEEQPPDGFFDELFFEIDGSSETEEEEESRWGDAEDNDDASIATSRHSTPRRQELQRKNSARIDYPVDLKEQLLEDRPPSRIDNEKSKSEKGVVDEKQAASFVDMIQRTFAQLHPPQGIIPNMSQLPLPQFPLPNLPHLPNLPGMPAVPWGALPQFPMVFPVFIPTSGWPSFRGDKREDNQDTDVDKSAGDESQTVGAGAIRTAQELRATWEKWMALAIATATRQVDDTPPPVYTPRATKEEQIQSQSAETSQSLTYTSASAERPITRRFNYDTVPVPAREANSYAYRPAQTQQMQKKHDRMLILFWIPILLISLLWGFVVGLQSVIHAVRTALPLRSLLST